MPMVHKHGQAYFSNTCSYACLHCWCYVYIWLFFFAEEIFAYVSWPEEDNDVSVISSTRNRIIGFMKAGAKCEVRFGKKSFPAVVRATGL